MTIYKDIIKESKIHNTPLWKWEEENNSQDRLIELTNETLERL
jgi:hypothetical protein